MKLFSPLFVSARAVAHLLRICAHAPMLRGAAVRAAPISDATLSYIHSAWDTLTRSVTDCNSLADIKVDNAAAAAPCSIFPPISRRRPK